MARRPPPAPARPFGHRRGAPAAPPPTPRDELTGRFADLLARARSAASRVPVKDLRDRLAAHGAALLSRIRHGAASLRAAWTRWRGRRRVAAASLAPLAPPAPPMPRAPLHPALRSLADEFRGALVRVLAYLAALGLLALGAAELLAEPPVLLASVAPVQRSPWTEVGRPHPAFTLDLPELADADHRYAIQRHVAGGGRKDILAWGEAGGAGPFAQVEIYRAGQEPESFADAPTEIAARLVAFDIADDVKPAGTLASKFGPVRLVDFALRQQERPRRCLGFVRVFGAVRMQIAGWYCNPGPEVVERATLSCALDRLAVLSAGSDPQIAQLFARAELRRDFCRHKDPILYATPRRGDPPAVDTRLRGRQAAR